MTPIHLAALIVGLACAQPAAASPRCEGDWSTGCRTLTYDGIEAGYCAHLPEDGICRSWQWTAYGEEADRRRTAALPECPKGLGFLELSDYARTVHACKVSPDRVRLVPGAEWAD